MSSFKRAHVHSIARYLYDLPGGWAGRGRAAGEPPASEVQRHFPLLCDAHLVGGSGEMCSPTAPLLLRETHCGCSGALSDGAEPSCIEGRG